MDRSVAALGRSNTAPLFPVLDNENLGVIWKHVGRRWVHVQSAKTPAERVVRLARWATFRRTMRDASCKPGCLRDQEQPGCDDDRTDGSRDALAGWGETFGGDRRGHDSHRAGP